MGAREGLYEGERLIVARDTVRGALAVRRALAAPPPELGPALVLLARSGAVLVHVDRMETAYRLEQALQLDAEHRRAQVLYRKPMGFAIVGAVILSMLAFVVAASWLPKTLLVPAMLTPFLLVAFWYTTLTIGDDGVSLRTLGHERFMPYPDIESVGSVQAADPGRRIAPRFTLRSGKELTMDQAPELQSRSGVQIDEAVLDRARDALEQYRTRAKRAPVLPLSLSAQSTGSPAERVRALTSKQQGGDAYRQSATDEDALRRAVDEPTLPPRLRAEAALMLAAARNDDDLERIRRAAERSACRPLRELFEAAAAGASEAKLARALGRVR